MSFKFFSSERSDSLLTTAQLMQWVLFALIPGILCEVIFFGLAPLIQIMFAVITAIVFEACCLRLRKRPVIKTLSDNTAIISALLLALSIPATSPWWLIVIGVFFTIVVAKQLYGGLGQNIFNPAMVGYVVLLIAFPVQMTAWPAPNLLSNEQIFNLIFLPNTASFDSITSATVLDAMREVKTVIDQQQVLNKLALFSIHNPWSWINLSYLVGGILLMMKRIVDWRLPCFALMTFVLLTSIHSLLSLHSLSLQHASSLSPMMHLFSGATMLAVFFIITDPVTTATSPRGRIYFAILFALLLFVIRIGGHYPDSVAFATLLANLCVPLIDYFTRPKVYGH